jgi:hypothetical protein
MSIVNAPLTEPAAAYAVRGRRHAVAVLTVATLFGLWLGTSAPDVSPVATPVVPAAQNAAPVDQRGPGRGR